MVHRFYSACLDAPPFADSGSIMAFPFSMCPFSAIKRELQSDLQGLSQAYLVVRSGSGDTRYSDAPTQSSEYGLCLKLSPPSFCRLPPQPPRQWAVRGPGGMHSNHDATLPIVWVVQTCSLSQVAPTSPRTAPPASTAMNRSDFTMSWAS